MSLKKILLISVLSSCYSMESAENHYPKGTMREFLAQRIKEQEKELAQLQPSYGTDAWATRQYLTVHKNMGQNYWLLQKIDETIQSGYCPSWQKDMENSKAKD